jgi:hypothetical protein
MEDDNKSELPVKATEKSKGETILDDIEEIIYIKISKENDITEPADDNGNLCGSVPAEKIFIREMDLPAQPGETLPDGLFLELKRARYKKTKNPIELIESFVIAMENRIYPPIWVLDALYNAFKEYEKRRDVTTLDKILGLSGSVSGKDGTYKKRLEGIFNDNLMADMFKLTLLGFKLDNAAHMVAAKLKQADEKEPINKTAFRIKTTKSAYRLLTMYKQARRTWLKEREVSFKKVLETREQKKLFLESFPDIGFNPKNPKNSTKLKKHN